METFVEGETVLLCPDEKCGMVGLVKIVGDKTCVVETLDGKSVCLMKCQLQHGSTWNETLGREMEKQTDEEFAAEYKQWEKEHSNEA